MHAWKAGRACTLHVMSGTLATSLKAQSSKTGEACYTVGNGNLGVRLAVAQTQ